MITSRDSREAVVNLSSQERGTVMDAHGKEDGHRLTDPHGSKPCTDGPVAGSRPTVRNRPTPEGQELGHHLARFCDDAEPIARLKVPDLPPRCNSCAFREGQHTANGSPTTQMDALKCVMEGHEFYCHEPNREGWLCMGWAMWMLAKDDAAFVNLPWNFSDESEAQ